MAFFNIRCTTRTRPIEWDKFIFTNVSGKDTTECEQEEAVEWQPFFQAASEPTASADRRSLAERVFGREKLDSVCLAGVCLALGLWAEEGRRVPSSVYLVYCVGKCYMYNDWKLSLCAKYIVIQTCFCIGNASFHFVMLNGKDWQYKNTA